MIESGYYPIGEEYNPNAPYNQSNIEPIQLNVIISQSLSRPTTIEVTDYITNEWEDIEIDENGKFHKIEGIEYDFSDSDLKETYERQEYTIPELLDYLKDYLITDINKCNEESKKRKLQHILKCCKDWEVDETEVIEN